ncbi:MAG: hypothetical protein IJT85_09615 [Ruminococcus sp.]|nr:hypothetical protein [Ruminococcus sp.]
MYSNYFLINETFLSEFALPEKNSLGDFAYTLYTSMRKTKTNLLSKENYFKSNRTKYSVVYLYCPKCKSCGFTVCQGVKQANELKFCVHCGEPNITYRYLEGIKKISELMKLSQYLKDNHKTLSLSLNQQLCVQLCSVYEVYLREFYADILNTMFVKSAQSLYNKFVTDCKNDFLNPGKTNDRLKKEININYKEIIGKDRYKTLLLLSEYRNVIVHNNGICDNKFINQHPEVQKHSQITPNIETIFSFFCCMGQSVTLLDKEYQRILKSQAITSITETIKLGKLKIFQYKIV